MSKSLCGSIQQKKTYTAPHLDQTIEASFVQMKNEISNNLISLLLWNSKFVLWIS